MEQESNLEVKPDVKFFLFEEKPDIESLPVKVETTSLHLETKQDSICLLTEQKPDTKLFFLKDEPSECDITSVKSASTRISLPVSKPCLELNSTHSDPEFSKKESIEYIESKREGQACGDCTSITEEKPCIAALRALVEAYPRNEEKKNTELEILPSSCTELSTPVWPENSTSCFPSTYLQATSQEFLVNQESSTQLEMGKKENKHGRSHSESRQFSILAFPNDEVDTTKIKNTANADQTVTHKLNPQDAESSSEKSFESKRQSLPQKFALPADVHCDSDEKLNYRCDVCNTTYNLTRHMSSHTGEKLFHKHQCGQGFRQRSKLTKCSTLPPDGTPLKRDECGNGFRKNSENVILSTLHSDEKSYKCNKCSKVFKQSSELKQHSTVHSGERPYKCDNCGKSFRQSSHLNKHSLIHTGEKPHKCGECGKGFRQSQDLRAHSLIHTGEKPYKCHECGKGFRQNTHLKKHLSVHTGEKLYMCDECGKVFRQSSDLRAHSTVHTGKKSHRCDECGKWFTRSTVLRKHSLIHKSKKMSSKVQI
ncbi:Zinc finger protein 239 [Plakobranchus ocellatus]|uniref:Zinc finger protein 239 n=1 Tax=Plakobranchus ocellatus TaxID=259542 RepID=A0AAV4C485_9GAST|nr:Zinc finger protein 239 [Plakobranchus ocellatus]